MLDLLWNLDLTLFRFINQTLSFDWLDQITPVLTNLDNYLWIKIALPLVIFLFFYRKYKRLGVTYFLFLILTISTSDFVGGKIKKIVLRPRPFQIAETQTILKAEAKEDRSFYSNHASNNFAAATYLTAFFPGGQIYFFAIATTIALTRVHVGVHYPSDIIAGALMGLLWGLIFSRLVKNIYTKKNENLS
jgi:undecaprenyl-diphosphatase